jgi:Tol biopolymer transport system component
VWCQAGWSPDGRRIMVSAQAGGVHDVWVMNADGTGLTRLTKGAEGLR